MKDSKEIKDKIPKKVKISWPYVSNPITAVTEVCAIKNNKDKSKTIVLRCFKFIK
jgi:hypothetical protein